MKLRLITAYILLSLATIVLVGVSVRFFTSPPVLMQLGAWAGQMLPAGMTLQPQPNQRFASLPAERASVQPPTPTAAAPHAAARPLTRDAAAAQPEPLPESAPTRLAPTTAPVYQVVEGQQPEGSLVIPSLGINQPLVPVLVRDQAWDLSDLGSAVGWLQTTGTYPGDELAMVLVGHITLPYPGGPGPFLELHTLQPGEIVEYRSGQWNYVYQVKGQSVISPGQVDSLYQPGSSLLLVTCTGYNPIEQKYDLRLFVEAELVRVEDRRAGR